MVHGYNITEYRNIVPSIIHAMMYQQFYHAPIKKVLGTSFLRVKFIDGCCNPYVFKPNDCKRRRAKIDWPSSYTGKIVKRWNKV